MNSAIKLEPINNFDCSNLDGHLLKTMIAMVETGAVTVAAQRLELTQSAVSH